jgi:hypothetical protein
VSTPSVPGPRSSRASGVGPRRLRAITAAGCAIAALALRVVGAVQVYQSISLATRGTVVNARVLAVRYGSRADNVRVELSRPVSRHVDLIAWTGHPQVGETISVRYDPHDSSLAEQDGTWPWDGVLAAFAGAAFLSFLAWWQVSVRWRRLDVKEPQL